MLTIRDLPGIIERAIPMPPHATIGQGAAVERLRAVTEAQVREVIEAERAEALQEARDEINRTRNLPSLMTLADKFGCYYLGLRAGLEMAEGIVSRIERDE
ncbi:hypothetical protein [Microbacterium sp.]|uniref:hypothetical protein n=1 Tax=Microbacterium sp. TaxID=51671 RepID=UPI002FE094A8